MSTTIKKTVEIDVVVPDEKDEFSIALTDGRCAYHGPGGSVFCNTDELGKEAGVAAAYLRSVMLEYVRAERMK